MPLMSELIYFTKKAKYDYARICIYKGKYYVDIQRFYPGDYSPETNVLTVSEVIDILSHCLPEGIEIPSKRVVDVIYRSFYKCETTPNSSIPECIDDPVFDTEGYSINPLPQRPDYEMPTIVIGWKEWEDKYAGKDYCDWIASLNVTPGKDGKVCFDYSHLNFSVSAEELLSLVQILKVIDKTFSSRKK